MCVCVCVCVNYVLCKSRSNRIKQLAQQVFTLFSALFLKIGVFILHVCICVCSYTTCMECPHRSEETELAPTWSSSGL